MDVVTPSHCQRRKLADIRTCRRWSQLRALVGKQSNATVTLLVAVRVTRFGETRPQSNTLRVFGSTTRVTRVSLTDMHNINNPALQVERLVLLSDKSNLFYQGHTVLRSSRDVSTFLLVAISIENRELSHTTREATARTPEATTLATLGWLLVLPNWDNTSAGSWCSTAMFALSELTRAIRVVLPNTLSVSAAYGKNLIKCAFPKNGVGTYRY